MLLYVLVLVLLIFFVFSTTRNRNARARQAAELKESIVPGVRVMTTSGLHATIVAVDEGSVVLEIAPGVQTTWARAAVSRRLDEPTTTVDDPTDGPSVPERPER